MTAQCTAPSSARKRAAQLMISAGDVRLLSGIEATAFALREKADELERIGRSENLSRAEKVQGLGRISGQVAHIASLETWKAIGALNDIHAAEVVAMEGEAAC